MLSSSNSSQRLRRDKLLRHQGARRHGDIGTIFCTRRRRDPCLKLILCVVVSLLLVYHVEPWNWLFSDSHANVIAEESLGEPALYVSRTTTAGPFDTAVSRLKTVPFVSGETLNRLFLTHDTDYDDFELQRWPAKVTHIPLPRAQTILSSPSPLDELCVGPTKCKFLIPHRIGEQESKARIHFTEIIQLARDLGRIVVLPRVGKSRLGFTSSQEWEFESYYDVDLLKLQMSDVGLYAITLDELNAWIGRAHHYTVRAISLGTRQSPTSRNCRNDDFDYFSICVYDTVKSPRYLSERHISLPSLQILPNLDYRSESTHGALGAPISTFLDTSTSDEDVLVVHWDLRYPIFSKPLVQLDYSPELRNLAQSLSPRNPYLMVHWRMETIDPSVLSLCAHSLVDTLTALLYDEGLAGGVEFIWFASDLSKRSGTFKNAGDNHTAAVRILHEAFEASGPLNKWELIDLSTRLHDDNDGFFRDAGVLGILDKIIGMRAALFVSGNKGCGRVSSFTRQIIQSRHTTQAPYLRNTVDLFG